MNRIGKLVLLMLQSDQPGEIAAAAAAIKRHLKSTGKDAHWLAEMVSRLDGQVVHVDRPTKVAERDWMNDLTFCATRPDRLSEREHQFVVSLYNQWTLSARWKPTERQHQWLSRIAEKLRTPDPFGRQP